jgi:hypothetical protein
MSSESLKIVAPPRSTRHEEPTVALQPLPPGMKHRFHAITPVRLKVEQIQLVSGVRQIGLGCMGLQGA